MHMTICDELTVLYLLLYYIQFRKSTNKNNDYYRWMLNVNTAVSVDTVDSITLDKVRGLRDLLNSSAMDIMYYTSPLYRDEVKLYSPNS